MPSGRSGSASGQTTREGWDTGWVASGGTSSAGGAWVFCDWDATTANLGYRLRPEWWGLGLATEGCLALLQHGLDDVGLDSVWASTTAHNEASQRVLTKLGMTYVGVEYDQCQYEISGAARRSTP